MLFSPLTVFLSILILSNPLTLANPTPRQTLCRPNFSGRAMSIVANSGLVEWGPGYHEPEGALLYQAPTYDKAEFRAEFTGDPDNTYYLKSALDPSNSLHVKQTTQSNWLAWSSGPVLKWEILCTWCNPSDATFWHGTYASSCTIRSTLGSLCATESPDGVGGDIKVWGCDGRGHQYFDFILP